MEDRTSWPEIDQGRLRAEAMRLFSLMLDSRPNDSQWARLRSTVTLLFDVRACTEPGEATQPQTQSEPAPDLAAGPEPGAAPPAETGARADPATLQPPAAQPHPIPIPSSGTYTGTFHRGLKGGTLVTDNGLHLPIPECIVAKVRMNHGYVVRAKYDGFYLNGKPRYYCTVVDPCGGDHPDRAEDAGYVQQTEDGSFAVKANGLEIQISEADLRENGCSAGDVVSAAYWRSELQGGRVAGALVRVHASLAPAKAPPQPPPQRLRRAESSGQAPPAPEVRFAGSPRVLIVGGRNWRFYRDGIAQLGGEAEYLDGFARDRFVPEFVACADIVVIIKTNCSHGHHAKVKAEAKERGLLFYPTKRENWSGLRRLFEREIIPRWNARGNTTAAD